MRKLFMLLVAVALVAVMAAPVFAAGASRSPGATATISGRMLTDIGWWNQSKELTTNGSSDVGSAFVNMPGHSFLRARWRTKDATAGARIELGLAALQPSATVSLRYAYGWYRFGRCRILAGQTDNWFSSLAYHPRQYVGLNNDAHLLLFGWGLLWPHRVTQVQFTWNTDKFGIQFALEDPRVKTSPFAGTDMYFTLPRMSLTAMVKAGGFMTHPGFSFVQRDIEGHAIGSESYATWAFVLPIMFKAGAFTLKFQFHYGMNFLTEYPFYPAVSGPIYSADSENIQDTYTWGGFLAVEYKFGKAMVTGGFGYENFSNDSWQRNGYDQDEVSRWAAFVAVPYQVNKYFGIHPEFSYYNHGDDASTGNDAGTEWMIGAQFRFIF